MSNSYKVLGWDIQDELGAGTAATGTFEILIPKADVPDIEVALLYAKNDSFIPQYNAPMYPGMDMYCYSRNTRLRENADSQWVITTQCNFRPGHMIGKDYVAYFRPACDLRTTSHDYNGLLLSVPYTPPGYSEPIYQAGSVEVLYPGGEIVCKGISAVADPITFQGNWEGYANSTKWLGLPAGSVVCLGATPEPISLSESPPRYWFTFTFKIKMPLPGSPLMGWQVALEWLNRDGVLPNDADWGNGLTPAMVYPPADFNTMAPLGVPAP